MVESTTLKVTKESGLGRFLAGLVFKHGGKKPTPSPIWEEILKKETLANSQKKYRTLLYLQKTEQIKTQHLLQEMLRLREVFAVKLQEFRELKDQAIAIIKSFSGKSRIELSQYEKFQQKIIELEKKLREHNFEGSEQIKNTIILLLYITNDLIKTLEKIQMGTVSGITKNYTETWYNQQNIFLFFKNFYEELHNLTQTFSHLAREVEQELSIIKKIKIYNEAEKFEKIGGNAINVITAQITVIDRLIAHIREILVMEEQQTKREQLLIQARQKILPLTLPDIRDLKTGVIQYIQMLYPSLKDRKIPENKMKEVISICIKLINICLNTPYSTTSQSDIETTKKALDEGIKIVSNNLERRQNEVMSLNKTKTPIPQELRDFININGYYYNFHKLLKQQMDFLLVYFKKISAIVDEIKTKKGFDLRRFFFDKLSISGFTSIKDIMAFIVFYLINRSSINQLNEYTLLTKEDKTVKIDYYSLYTSESVFSQIAKKNVDIVQTFPYATFIIEDRMLIP